MTRINGPPAVGDETRSAREAGASTLDELFAPVSPKEFVETYWGRRALYVKGPAGKFAGLFDSRRFDAAIREAFDDPYADRFRLAALVETSSERPLTLSFMRPITPDEVEGSMREGMTICVNDIGAGDAKLRTFARTIRKEMSYAGSVHVNCYRSPSRSGAPFHIDSRMTTTLQIEGRKRWRYGAEPAVPWPPSNAQVRRDGSPEWLVPVADDWAHLERPDGNALQEVVLEPGDLLCLPAGTWHETEAIGGSLALNLSFGPLSFATIVGSILDMGMGDRVEWRGGVPPVAGAKPGEMPSVVSEYMRARLREARDFLAGLDTHDVVELWDRFTP
ncbi:MAG: cupin domain-containing protein [Actinomycetota bacterium]|nr:cupin domain-containing protein [Actinomycetota bacterium]